MIQFSIHIDRGQSISTFPKKRKKEMQKSSSLFCISEQGSGRRAWRKLGVAGGCRRRCCRRGVTTAVAFNGQSAVGTSSDGEVRRRLVHLRRERRKPGVLRLQDVHGLRDGRPLALVRVRAPQPDDEHPLNAPVIGFVAAGPQSLVRRVEDCIPAVQAPHPLD